MKKKLIVANWKMNLSIHQASLLAHKLNEKITATQSVEVVLCPPFLALQSLSLQINHRKLKLGAQNCYWRDEGAYTGEISAAQLRGLASYVIVGHSERRHIFGETDKDIRSKIQAVVRSGLRPILCVGETATERLDGEEKHVLHSQLISGLANLTSEEIHDVVVAYEPVWAIGTGKLPKPTDVAAAAREIRRQVEALYGAHAAENIHILYGGSVDAHSAADYLAVPGIDGLLVGSASLHADTFETIVKKAQEKTLTKEDK